MIKNQALRYYVAPMKPKDFKYPFSWEERKPALSDGVLFVPKFFDRHKEWKFNFFTDDKPVFIEYCSGNGAWIIEKAIAHPEINWIAVEMRFDRVRKIWSKGKNNGLTNLLVVAGEALTFTRNYVAPQSIAGIYVNFPDPWPKDRHAKHRLISPAFAEELARIILPGGTATYATDDPPYSETMVQTMKDHPAWIPAYATPHYITEWPSYGDSYFNNLWVEKGRTIRYIQFAKR